MERRKFTREFKLEAVRLIKDRGVSYTQASTDLGVHQSQLRDWVKRFAEDPQQAFPGQGQMKPEQLEIARLKRGRAVITMIIPCFRVVIRTLARVRSPGGMSVRGVGLSPGKLKW